MLKFNVLVVDDIEANIISFEAILEDISSDIEIFSALGAEEALQIIMKRHIDIIFTDIQMPNIDGFEFVRLLKTSKKTKDIPIVFMTAIFDEDSFKAKGYSLGAIDYVTKPIDHKIMIPKIRNYLKLFMMQSEVKDLKNSLSLKVEAQVKELREKDVMLLKQSKLAIMGEMLNMIAHQWRQPLTTITTATSMINLEQQMDMLNDDKLKENLNTIDESAYYLSNTIEDFRDFFSKNKVKQKLFPMHMIEKIENLLDNRIKKNNINIIKDCNCTEKILTYPNELQQITINILNNAIDEFESKSIDNPTITISSHEIGDDYLEITINDNAGGIPENIIDKVFEPYFSTKSKNGTGLGLYMSKMIVHESLGGELLVENKNGGAMFIVKLPFDE